MNKTTSKAPLVLGIVGGVLGILSGVCNAFCGSAVSEADQAAGGVAGAAELGQSFLIGGILALVGAIAGLVGGCCAKSQKWGSLVQLLGGVLCAVSLIWVLDLFALAAAVLCIVGGAVGLSKHA